MTEGLKQREGDQPLPTMNDERDIQSRVVDDSESRRLVGIQRYGTALQPFNGRDALQDAYEEAIDLAMYLKQLMVERNQGRVRQPIEIAFTDDWLRDQHARYHDMPGNLYGEKECGETRCEFWFVSTWVRDAALPIP